MIQAVCLHPFLYIFDLILSTHGYAIPVRVAENQELFWKALKSSRRAYLSRNKAW